MASQHYLTDRYPTPPTDNARSSSEVIEQYQEQLAAIHGDARLSAQAKRDDITRLFRDVSGKIEALREADRVDMDKRRTELERTAFGLGSGTVTGSDAISMRDASDRVSKIRRDDEALELMERARLNGDLILEKAVAVQAHLMGFPNTFAAYGATHPAFAPQLDELDGLRSVEADIGYAAWFYLSAPPETRYPAAPASPQKANPAQDQHADHQALNALWLTGQS